MFDSRKLILLCGLVVMTGPLSFTAQAQSGYVDLEAEAAAREAARAATGEGVPADPYGVQPTPSYPVTSYGVNPAPIATAGTQSPGASGNYPASGNASAPVSAAAGPASGSNLGSLVLQIQQLQQEVMRLNGKVEEQAHELRTLQEQSLQRYRDLDKRLSSGAGASAASGSGSAAPVAAPIPVANAGAANRGSGGSAQPGEKSAYDGAYGLVVGRQFDRAIPAFQQFLRDFPDGKYAPNAHYWLGELYLVLDPPDLESSRQAFALLISQYPDHSKVPDAFFKLGKVQFMKGNREKAREYLDLVIEQYGSSNPTVVKLAQDFIAENY